MKANTPAVDWGDCHALVDKFALASRQHRSHRSVERDLQQGTAPPHLKIGKKTLFRIADVLAWETERRFASTAEAKAARAEETAQLTRRSAPPAAAD